MCEFYSNAPPRFPETPVPALWPAVPPFLSCPPGEGLSEGGTFAEPSGIGFFITLKLAEII